MRKYALLVPISSLLGVLIYIYLFFSETGRFPNIENEGPYYAISLLLANLMGFLVNWIDRKFDTWIGWKNLFFTRFLSGFLVNSILVSLLILAIGFILVNLLSPLGTAGFYHQWREEMWKLGI